MATSNESRTVPAVDDVGATGRMLIRHLQARRETQCSQIARLLHHDVSGMLAAARMDLSRLASRTEEEWRQQVARIDQLIEQVIRDARAEMQRLHPALLDHFGLPMALRHLVSETCHESGVQYTLEMAESAEGLEPQVALACYRLVETLLAPPARPRELYVGLTARRDRCLLRLRTVPIDAADASSAPWASSDVQALRIWLESFGAAWVDSRGEGGLWQLDLDVPRRTRTAGEPPVV